MTRTGLFHFFSCVFLPIVSLPLFLLLCFIITALLCSHLYCSLPGSCIWFIVYYPFMRINLYEFGKAGAGCISGVGVLIYSAGLRNWLSLMDGCKIRNE